MGKSLTQLKKELAKARAKEKQYEAKLKAARKIEAETRKIKSELKKLNRSQIHKEFRKFGRKKMTKENAIKLRDTSIKAGKKALKTGRKIWRGLGTVINHLDRMNDPVRTQTKKRRGRR